MADPIEVVITDSPTLAISVGDASNPTHGALGWAWGNGRNTIASAGLFGEGVAPSLAVTRRIILRSDIACDAVVHVSIAGTLVAVMTLASTDVHDRTDLTPGMSEGDRVLFELVSVSGSPHLLVIELLVTRYT